MAPETPRTTAVARLRLAAQGLLQGVPPATLDAPATTPQQVVAALGMMQAQDLPQVCWAVGVRLPGAGLSDIHAALADGSVIRCWGARGTLMLIDPALHGRLMSVTAPRMNAKMAATRAQEDITAPEIARLAEVARERCAGAGATRTELLDAFAASGSSIAGQRGYHLIVAASLHGGIVQGPMEPGSETRQLFMAAGSWIRAGAEVPDARRALELLVRTYFESHGPATVADCAWWLGIPLTPVRAAVADLAGVLGSRELGGVAHHFAAAHAKRWEHPPGARSVLALPGFDEFVLGYKDRSATLPQEHVQAVTPGKNGIFLRTVAAGGQTVGTWELAATGKQRRGRFVPFGAGEGTGPAAGPARGSGEGSPARAAQVAARIEAYLEFRSS